MITYLKNEKSVIKVNHDQKTLMLINNSENSSTCVFESNLLIFADVTATKTGEGFFVEATEQDYIAAKEIAAVKLSTF